LTLGRIPETILVNPDDDKWESFETYKGPPEREWPVWLDRICKVFFSFVALGLVFSICGGLLWIAPYGERGLGGFVGRWLAANEEPWMAWSRFIIGGVIGNAIVIRCLRRPKTTSPTSRV
jgi:hypothetical protein